MASGVKSSLCHHEEQSSGTHTQSGNHVWPQVLQLQHSELGDRVAQMAYFWFRARVCLKKKWWQPFENTTNIDNCWLPHRDTQEMSLAYRHEYTAAHTHSRTCGRGREREDKDDGKKKEKEEEGRRGRNNNRQRARKSWEIGGTTLWEWQRYSETIRCYEYYIYSLMSRLPI